MILKCISFFSVSKYGYINKLRYRNKEVEKLNPPNWLYDKHINSHYLYHEYDSTYCTIHVLIPLNANI
jgi:hypothetical protein